MMGRDRLGETAWPRWVFERPITLTMKRNLSAHQKQMRFMTVMFITLALVLFVGLLYLFNR